MNHTIIPNTNHALRAVLVLHGDARPEVQTFPVIAWRVDAETGTNIPVLAGGLENWAITEQGSEMVCPLDPGALPTTRKAFVARNATV
jgi:hypothetical protein